MNQSGTSYNRDTWKQWLQAINHYFNESGDSPEISNIQQVTPKLANEAQKAIEEDLLFFPGTEPQALSDAQLSQQVAA